MIGTILYKSNFLGLDFLVNLINPKLDNFNSFPFGVNLYQFCVEICSNKSLFFPNLSTSFIISKKRFLSFSTLSFGSIILNKILLVEKALKSVISLKTKSKYFIISFSFIPFECDW